jgi:catechol 2,3-dioxygenase-like lactoylglutathione lyase family enzyme
LHGTAAALEAQGQPVIWQDRYKIGGVERFFIRDPDGNRIEVQGPDGSGRSRWE